MTDMEPYERLELVTAQSETDEVQLDAYLWRSLFEYADGPAPDPDSIESAHVWAVSPEGYGSTDIALIARLTDGQWATCVAWSDTTGFGCQQGVDWRRDGPSIDNGRRLAHQPHPRGRDQPGPRQGIPRTPRARTAR